MSLCRAGVRPRSNSSWPRCPSCISRDRVRDHHFRWVLYLLNLPPRDSVVKKVKLDIHVFRTLIHGLTISRVNVFFNIH